MNSTIQGNPDGGFTVLPLDHRNPVVIDRVAMMQALADDACGPGGTFQPKREVRPTDPGMYGVQETYEDPDDYRGHMRDMVLAQGLDFRLLSRKHVLTIPGCGPIEFDSRDEAEQYAIAQQGRAVA